jgi:hypothetical protein
MIQGLASFHCDMRIFCTNTGLKEARNVPDPSHGEIPLAEGAVFVLSKIMDLS